jgi:hypothetical protein
MQQPKKLSNIGEKYGSTPKAVQTALACGIEEAATFHQEFWKKFKKIKEYR